MDAFVAQGWMPLAIFAAGFAVRWLYRSAGLFQYDGVALAQAVEETAATGTLHGQVNGRYGTVLVNLLAYLPLRALGWAETAEPVLIATNVLFGAAAPVALYVWMRRLTGSPWAAGAAALSYSFSPVLLSVSTIGKPGGLEAFLVLWAFALAARFHDEGRLRDAALASASMGWAVFSREATLPFLPLFAAFALRPRWQRRPPWIVPRPDLLRPASLLALAAPVSALLAISWAAGLGEIVHRSLTGGGLSTVRWAGLASPVLPLALRDVWTDLTPLGAALAGLGLAAAVAVRRWRESGIWLAAWTALMLYFGNTNAYWAHHLTTVSAGWFGFVGLGVAALVEGSRRLVPLAALATLALVGLELAAIHPVLAHRARESGPREFAVWLASVVPENALVVAADEWPFVTYFARREVLYPPLDPRPETIRGWLQDVERLMAAGRPIYVMSSAFSLDPTGRFRRALRQRFVLRRVGARPTEDYHRAILVLRPTTQELYRLEPRGNAPPPPPKPRPGAF